MIRSGIATGHFTFQEMLIFTHQCCYCIIHIQMLHLNAAAVNFTVYEMLQILIQEGPCTELTVTLPQAFDL